MKNNIHTENTPAMSVVDKEGNILYTSSYYTDNTDKSPKKNTFILNLIKILLLIPLYTLFLIVACIGLIFASLYFGISLLYTAISICIDSMKKHRH